MTRRRKWIMIAGLALLLAILLTAVPVRQEPYTTYEQYPVTETYTEEEAYEVPVTEHTTVREAYKVPVAETYYVQEPYTDIKVYYVREPYTTTEIYYVLVPVQKTAPLTYSATGQDYSWYVFEPGFRAWVYLQNTDSQAGTFQVNFTLNLFVGGQVERAAGAYLQAGEQEKVEISYAGSYLSSFQYSVVPPNKTKMVYVSEPRTRLVIKYRDVRKERETTKYKDVPKERTVWETGYRYVPKTTTTWETRHRDVPKERTVWETRSVVQHRWVSLAGIVW